MGDVKSKWHGKGMRKKGTVQGGGKRGEKNREMLTAYAFLTVYTRRPHHCVEHIRKPQSPAQQPKGSSRSGGGILGRVGGGGVDMVVHRARTKQRAVKGTAQLCSTPSKTPITTPTDL